MSRHSQATGFDIRRAAAQRLQTVLTGAPFVPFGAREISDSRDRALANKLVTVSLRRHGQISRILSSVLEKGIPKRAGIFEAALRSGIAQLLFLPDMGQHAAIHLAVEVIKKDRRAGRFAKLANAALRNVQRGFSVDDLDPKDLVPAWVFTRWEKHYGETAALGMLDALLAPVPLDITGRPDQDQTELFNKMGAVKNLGASYRLEDRDVSVEELPGFVDGQWWIQDLASTLPVYLANPQPGQKVLDICAAPGGKTAQLAASGAEVTAVDLDGKRLERVKENLDRLKLNATLIEADATNLSAETQYDLVVLDAPCSATGTYRRHPEVLWHRREKDIKQRAQLQKEMLINAAHLVNVDGQLVFCTCSLEPEEGEVQVVAFLKIHPEFEVVPVVQKELENWTDPILEGGYVRTLPSMSAPQNGTGMDGFFAARLRRIK